MSMLTNYVDAFQLLLDPTVILMIAAGTILGLVMGALPGLTAAMTIALLIPLTFGLEPIQGIGMLLGGFVGAVAGGAIPAILLGIPGTPSSVATTLDGYPMAKNGQAGKALGIAISSSFVGGLVGAILLLLVAPPIANFALRFGSAEFFALGVFGLVIIASVSGNSMSKGLVAGLIGLLLSTVGADRINANLRFTGDEPALIMGISLLPALIGLFAVAQVLQDLATHKKDKKELNIANNVADAKPYWGILGRSWKILTSSTLIGTIVGAIPGAGGSISSFMAYDQAKRFSKTPEKFGKGHDEGLIASESANNSMAGGALIPVLTLGVPGEVATAVLMGGLTIQGVRPGPALFEQQTTLAYGIFFAFIMANIFMFLTQLMGIKLFVRVLKVPAKILTPLILMFCVIGVYGVSGNFFELWLMLGFGVLGFFLNRYGFGTAPVILGLILGTLVESNLRRGMLLFDGDWTQFLTRPISATLLGLSAVLLVIILFQRRQDVKKGTNAGN